MRLLAAGADTSKWSLLVRSAAEPPYVTPKTAATQVSDLHALGGSRSRQLGLWQGRVTTVCCADSPPRPRAVMSAKSGSPAASAKAHAMAVTPPKKTPPLSQQTSVGSPTQSSSGHEVCHDYARGMCTRGEACRFSHDVAISAAVKARLEVRRWWWYNPLKRRGRANRPGCRLTPAFPCRPSLAQVASASTTHGECARVGMRAASATTQAPWLRIRRAVGALVVHAVTSLLLLRLSLQALPMVRAVSRSG